MTTTSFGTRLRHERERRQIALTSIATNTKIATPLLEALERDDISRWPGGIYRRSFIKAYAAAIGLNPDAVLREFLAVFPDLPDASAFSEPSPGTAVSPACACTPAATGRVRLIIDKVLPPCQGGRILTDVRLRVGAAASDLGILTLIGVSFAATVGEFWMPLAVAMACYYLGGILVLGNTPGICLFAAIVRDDGSRTDEVSSGASGAHSPIATSAPRL